MTIRFRVPERVPEAPESVPSRSHCKTLEFPERKTMNSRSVNQPGSIEDSHIPGSGNTSTSREHVPANRINSLASFSRIQTPGSQGERSQKVADAPSPPPGSGYPRLTIEASKLLVWIERAPRTHIALLNLGPPEYRRLRRLCLDELVAGGYIKRVNGWWIPAHGHSQEGR